LASHTDANGNETQYRYDRSGALIEEKRADGGVSTYAYEARGLLSSRTSPSGQTTQLAYDAAGQMTEAADAAGTIRYGYDADGRVTHVEENGARSEREYDAAGQLIRYTDAGGHTIRYAYDGGGRLSVLTYPDGRQVEYRYDAAGRLSEVKDWAGRLTRYRYDENGRLIRTERPNRTVEVRDYDAAGRLRLLQDLVKPGIPLQQRRYAYNAIGQIEREDDKQYRYDELKRLVHCASPGRRRWYAYDAGGNLTETGEELQETQTVQSLHYGKDNRLRSCGDYPVEMDREGNLLYATDGKEMDAYRYDARNRLIQSVKASYGYDAENRRIRLDEEGRKTQYVWDPSETLDGLDHMLMELDSEGRVRAYYIYGHGLIGREDAAGNYRAYLYDARGSTTLLTDETGQVTDRYTYGPYGEEERHEGQTKQPYRYNGRDGVMTDADGLVYMRARYYHTKLKRFLNRDVVRGDLTDGQTFNRYAYVNGDPVNYIDPLGLFKEPSGKWKYTPMGQDPYDMLRQHGIPRTLTDAEIAAAKAVDLRMEFKGKGSSLTKIDTYVDLTGHRKDHILNRHRAGAGKPGKTEFPASWSDDIILHQVSDVASDPNAIRGVGKYDSPYAIGVRDGIEIRVDFYPNNHKYAGQISTAYPTNVPANSSN